MSAPPGIVLDTNIVLDLFVYADPATHALLPLLQAKALCWIAAAPMRVELERVLGYTHIAARLQGKPRTDGAATTAAEVLAKFDALAQLRPVAAKSAFTCKDPDDQQFIDLALAWQASLLSKDRAVLCMARRLATLGVRVAPNWATLSDENWRPLPGAR